MKLNVISAILLCSFTAVPVMAASKEAAAVKAKQESLAPEISVTELKSLVENKDKKNMVIIDANSEKSYKEGHVPGAIHFAKFESKLASVLPSDKSALIVAYCGNPMCSAWEDPAAKAKAMGYTNVRHLTAGIKGWREARYPVEH